MEGLRKNEKKREKIYCFFRSVLIYCFFPSVPLSATAFILREEIFFFSWSCHQQGRPPRRKAQKSAASCRFFFFDKKVAALLLYQKKKREHQGYFGHNEKAKKGRSGFSSFSPFRPFRAATAKVSARLAARGGDSLSSLHQLPGKWTCRALPSDYRRVAA